MHSLKNIVVRARIGAFRQERRRRQRHGRLRELNVFNDYMLNDIGVCRLHISGSMGAALYVFRTHRTDSARRRLPAFVGIIGVVLEKWRRRVRARRELRGLDMHLLHDIGVTGQQARDEWRKPFWQQ